MKYLVGEGGSGSGSDCLIRVCTDVAVDGALFPDLPAIGAMA